MIAPTAGRLLLSYLGLVQFLFLLTWAVYAIFLGDLLVRLGLPKEFAPRRLLLRAPHPAVGGAAVGNWGAAVPDLAAGAIRCVVPDLSVILAA
ncbi:hypothetical protein [uncultured Thiodictyon sp.]|uniref:hypothetical protein n=1 Tax=uncultured Thiodictyon sp. TaxID=1846217 RepID=UPI0025F954B9|nr:hypothetical protein [uncultured Thiodictyon sp.]